jgi:hypothetical protein
MTLKPQWSVRGGHQATGEEVPPQPVVIAVRFERPAGPVGHLQHLMVGHELHQVSNWKTGP